MVKRYSLDGSNCDSYYGCSAKMTECDKGGAFVLATDYAALEAERDALARQINPDGVPVDIAALCLEIDTVTDERDEWKRRCEKICNWIDNNNDNGAGEAIYAIAEGRDNG